MYPRPLFEEEASQAAALHWGKASSARAIRAWKRRLAIKRFMWRLAFGSAECLKRFLDILGSSIALFTFLPIFIILAVAIFLEDRGPVFFKQLRIGQGGKNFYIWKFRSMWVDADDRIKEFQALNQHAQGVTFKMKNDPRVTRVGAFIRRSSLDELPQFINVLKGEMSLVGPRPPLPREVAQYKAAQLRRLTVKPGITCLWQIGGRANIDFEGQVRLDLQYIKSESIWQDIKILLCTVPAVLLGKGAY